MADAVSVTLFRNAMARVCAPVTIVTTEGPHGRGGFTATAMCSVTDAPPTLLVCMNAGSAQAGLFLDNARFCVNVLDQEHRDLAGLFAGREAAMQARYDAAEWEVMQGGSPALKDAIVSFDCVLSQRMTIGSHNVLVGQVQDIRIRRDGAALLYFDRHFVHVPSPGGSFGG